MSKCLYLEKLTNASKQEGCVAIPKGCAPQGRTHFNCCGPFSYKSLFAQRKAFEAALDGVITYRRVSSPEVKTQAVAPGLAHWFNHQTHHRAQVHAMLTGLAGKAPALDLLVYQRMWAEGLT